MKFERAGRRAVLLEQVGRRDVVQVIEARVKRLVLVAKRVHVGLVVEPGQLGEGVGLHVLDLALVQAEFRQHLRIGQHLLGVHRAVDPPEDVLASRVIDVRQLELLDVRPVAVVAGVREVLGARIHVQPVVEALAEREHMAAGPPRRLEHDDLVAALHQLVAATQPADAAAGDDHFLPRARLDLRRHQRRGAELQCFASCESRDMIRPCQCTCESALTSNPCTASTCEP